MILSLLKVQGYGTRRMPLFPTSSAVLRPSPEYVVGVYIRSSVCGRHTHCLDLFLRSLSAVAVTFVLVRSPDWYIRRWATCDVVARTGVLGRTWRDHGAI